MPQQDLFDRFHEPIIARDSDPESSHDAAADLTANQCVKLRGMQLLVQKLVQANPGLTGRELDAKHGDTQGQCHKRLKELERKGAIRCGEMRKCSISGHKVITWWPV